MQGTVVRVSASVAHLGRQFFRDRLVRKVRCHIEGLPGLPTVVGPASGRGRQHRVNPGFPGLTRSQVCLVGLMRGERRGAPPLPALLLRGCSGGLSMLGSPPPPGGNTSRSRRHLCVLRELFHCPLMHTLPAHEFAIPEFFNILPPQGALAALLKLLPAPSRTCGAGFYRTLYGHRPGLPAVPAHFSPLRG